MEHDMEKECSESDIAMKMYSDYKSAGAADCETFGRFCDTYAELIELKIKKELQ